MHDLSRQFRNLQIRRLFDEQLGRPARQPDTPRLNIKLADDPPISALTISTEPTKTTTAEQLDQPVQFEQPKQLSIQHSDLDETPLDTPQPKRTLSCLREAIDAIPVDLPELPAEDKFPSPRLSLTELSEQRELRVKKVARKTKSVSLVDKIDEEPDQSAESVEPPVVKKVVKKVKPKVPKIDAVAVQEAVLPLIDPPTEQPAAPKLVIKTKPIRKVISASIAK